MPTSKLIALLVALAASVSSPVRAAEPDAKGVEFFEKRIRPLLAAQCVGCHGPDKQKGGLRLDSRAAALAGGDSGPAMVPGDPAKSLLTRTTRHDDDLKMPPKGKLPDQDLADLSAWLKMGSPWPGGSTAAKQAGKPEYDALRRTHWAWQPVVSRPPPPVKNLTWAVTDSDRFVLARLEAKGLAPAPPADKRTLIRRVYFDLTGLPPTPEDIDAFLKEKSQEAFAAAVDRLLASPQFGEKWGRHWLDVARYADSNGGGANLVFDDAWRYRDYVIESLNADKPFDRFVSEQIAGDLLPAKDDAERRELLIATGFLLLGPKELAEYDKEKMRMDIVDEQVDTVGRAFLGLTLGCARCHDHKFDPIPTLDYYALAGIFRSTEAVSPTDKLGPISLNLRRPLPMSAERSKVAKKIGDDIRAALDKLAKAKADLKKLTPTGPKAEVEGAQAKVKAAEEAHAALKAREELVIDRALAVTDGPKPADSRVLIRGELSNPGVAAKRGFVSVAVTPRTPKVNPAQSGRAELARWLAASDNPLTARVFVNRVWQHLFGAGLVPTVDNFGIRGESPSHPELLDHLAARFVADGWSVKRLVRELVMSSAYRQSGGNPDAAAADPENRLLGRHPRRRLTAEELRDAVLVVSGRLDVTPGGATHTYNGRLGSEGQGRAVAGNGHDRRRSVYLSVYRGGYAPDLFQVFDFPDSGLVTGRRNVTTVPTQALFLMNSPFLMDHAAHVAKRVAAVATEDVGRVDAAYRIVFGRPATEAEVKRGVAYAAGGRGDAAWATFCHALLASNEFLFVE